MMDRVERNKKTKLFFSIVSFGTVFVYRFHSQDVLFPAGTGKYYIFGPAVVF